MAYLELPPYLRYALLNYAQADVEELKRRRGGPERFKLIEKMMASCKAHRKIVDMGLLFAATTIWVNLISGEVRELGCVNIVPNATVSLGGRGRGEGGGVLTILHATVI